MTEEATTEQEQSDAGAGFDPALLNPPWPLFEQLREHAPVMEIPELGAFLVTRYEDVHRILKDPKTFSSELEFGTGLSFSPSTPEKEEALAKGGYEFVPSIGFTDPPVHTRIRSAVQKAFSPRRVRQLEGSIQALSDEIVSGLDPSGTIDFAQEVALELPVMFIGESLGVEREDRDKFNRWSEAVLQRLGEQVSDEEDIELIGAYVESQHYFTEQIARRREKPTDDLLSDLVEAARDDEDPLSDDELMSILSFIPVAGSRTSAGLIGTAMHYLVDHPDHLTRVRAEPEFLDALIEETLRLQSPIQAWFRRTTEDVEIAGVKIPKDARVLVSNASANRDDDKFSCPNDFEADRENIKDHVAFGWGPHFCVGASLARAEARAAITSFLDRFSEVRMAPGAEAVYHPNLVHRMVDKLPLVVKESA